MKCLNCNSDLKYFPSNGVEGKFILADLQPANEHGIRQVKDGLVVDLFYCSECGFVFPKITQKS